MKIQKIVMTMMVLFVFILAACGGKAPDSMMEEPTESAMMDKPTEEAMMPHETPTADAMRVDETPTTDAMMMHETPTADAMMEPTDAAMMESPAWFDISLKDVRSGETFSINDFKGKVVLVETMAVWCSNCYQQQNQILALHDAMGMRDDFVSLSLDIDPNEDETALTSYTQKNSAFAWRYAITGVDVAHEIGNTLGDQFLNPPFAPIFVVDRHGVAHALPFGIKSADDLMKALQPFLDEKM